MASWVSCYVDYKAQGVRNHFLLQPSPASCQKKLPFYRHWLFWSAFLSMHRILEEKEGKYAMKIMSLFGVVVTSNQILVRFVSM